MIQTANLVTSGDIARQLGAQLWRVRHVLDSRPHIQPLGRVGNAKVYAPEAVDLVRAEFELIAAHRRHGSEPFLMPCDDAVGQPTMGPLGGAEPMA